ncbi:alpha/beta fold hydrolase [Dermatophilaceae bacterium Soc4.6]
MPPATTAPVHYVLPGLAVTDHVLPVPLDWAAADRGEPTETIEVFVREVVDPARRHDDLPAVVFLQGGPGGASPRPLSATGWIGELLRTRRVFLLDQRGTGRSSRVEGRRLAERGTPADQATYLGLFRGDSIVRDAEHARHALFGGRRWETLGQSYGGFVTLTYLSRAPQGLSACYVTGGLPSVRPDAADVYRRTFPRIAAKNEAWRERYPHAVDHAAAVADRVSVGDVRLPDGDLLTVRRLQLLGQRLGMKHGGDSLHWLLDEALDVDGEPTAAFLEQVLTQTSFATNPLFVVLQEPIYGDPASAPTGWAAQAERDRRPEFAESARPLLFTGETMFPWMMDEIRLLRPFREAADLLAARTDWEPLYDLDALAANEVPLAAAIYYEDMYVDAELQIETAAHLGATQTWVTNEWEHDGISDPRVVLGLRELIDKMGGPRA